jgi:hypothetical protein
MAAMERYLDLEPPRASLGQLQLTNKLEMRRVDDDVLGVAKSLKRIDPGLQLMYDEGQGIFVLYWKGLRPSTPGGPAELHEDLVCAVTELDQRLVKLIERIDAQGRGRADLETELRRLEQRRDAEQDAKRMDATGDGGERLLHALRRDLAASPVVHMSSSRGAWKERKDARRRQRQARKANR